MHRFTLQRWSVVFLLVGRLVLGEFVHAMPLGMVVPDGAAVIVSLDHRTPPCPEHTAMNTTATVDSADVQPSQSAEKNCCESGSCECPYAHLSAAVLASQLISCASVSCICVAAASDGIAHPRLSNPFRPPA